MKLSIHSHKFDMCFVAVSFDATSLFCNTNTLGLLHLEYELFVWLDHKSICVEMMKFLFTISIMTLLTTMSDARK